MFETPIFLLAAVIGGLLPLFLHLMQKRRALPIPFPTLRFLKSAQKAASRSIRIEHLLLWLLRTLIMVIFGMAFAMPVLRSGGGGGLLGRAPRDVAIVIDMSYSMGYQTGRETIFEQVLDMAGDIIRGLGENDRFCIYLASEAPRALVAEPIGDRDVGLAQLQNLRPDYGSSRLEPAIAAARSALQQSAGRRLQEIHVLTDNQALAWRRATATDADNGNGAPDVDTRDQNVTFFVTLAGVPSPENITPTRIELMPSVLFQGSGARLTAELAHTGTPRDTTVSFFINNEEQARRSVTVGTTEAQQIVFAVPALDPGVHSGRIEVPRDNLAIDDAFHFMIRVRDQMPTLIAGGEQDTFFLRAALRAAAGGDAAFTRVEPGELAGQRFSDYASVFLCNALPLPGNVIMELERFVQRGGLLVIFPGNRAALGDYQAWRSLPGIPQEIRDLPRTESRQTLVWNLPQHPILQAIGDATTPPTIAVQRSLIWDQLASGSEAIVTLSSGLPMMLERPYGEGRVLLFSVSADRSSSSFPLTPFFLPLIAQIVEYGTGLGGVAPFLWGQRQLFLEGILPEDAATTQVTAPGGQQLTVRSTRQDGQTVRYLENATEPGIYTALVNGQSMPIFASNMRREESDLTPLPPEAVVENLRPETVYIAHDRESLTQLIQEHRVGRTFAEFLLWILLILIATEFVYANRLARARSLLSDQLTIDPSGRVRGHIHINADSGQEGDA